MCVDAGLHLIRKLNTTTNLFFLCSAFTLFRTLTPVISKRRDEVSGAVKDSAGNEDCFFNMRDFLAEVPGYKMWSFSAILQIDYTHTHTHARAHAHTHTHTYIYGSLRLPPPAP